jgi:hypothetical protein
MAGMRLLRVCGWAGVIAAVPAALIVGVVAAHRTSAPSPQPAGALGTTRAAHPHTASGRAGGQRPSAPAPRPSPSTPKPIRWSR